MQLAAALVATAAARLTPQTTPALFSPEWYERYRGPYSAPMEPFRIVGNIHYVGALNIASYLITTPEGHILIDTGTTTMHQGIASSIVIWSRMSPWTSVMRSRMRSRLPT